MAAGRHDITIEQGATFQLSLIWKDSDAVPIDITGYTARMQVRRRHTSDTTMLEFTSAAGDITLGGAAGTIVVSADAPLTGETARSAVYDIELVSPAGVITRLLEGDVTITPEVTR